MRGYLARKKNIHYYKCNQQGCSNNISAKYLHKTFKGLLAAYLIDEKYADLIKHQIRETIKEINETNTDNLDLMKAKLKDTDKKMERLEERFILE